MYDIILTLAIGKITYMLGFSHIGTYHGCNERGICQSGETIFEG